MESYQFGSLLLPHRKAWLCAIASEWITAGGINSKDEVLEAFEEFSNEELAKECIEQWFLEHPIVHTSTYEADLEEYGEPDRPKQEELAAAFEELRNEKWSENNDE